MISHMKSPPGPFNEQLWHHLAATKASLEEFEWLPLYLSSGRQDVTTNRTRGSLSGTELPFNLRLRPDSIVLAGSDFTLR
jgi:hypothetical protein